MGSYTFRWEHPASEVYVTGNFDDWGKSVRLDRKGDAFEKTVELPFADEKVLYKFVVDNNWTTDHTAHQESDGFGGYNNVLRPDEIHSSPAARTMSSAAPGSSSAQLAGQQARQQQSDLPDTEHIPGAFPETPGLETQMFAVNPIPASSGSGNPFRLAPGEKVPDPSTFNRNTVSSTVHDDAELKAQDEQRQREQHEQQQREQREREQREQAQREQQQREQRDRGLRQQREHEQRAQHEREEGEQAFRVAPIPASIGAGNPVINLRPGESVPHPSTFTSNTVDSTVRLDKESYERSDAGPPQLGPVLTPQSEREAQGADIFNMPGISRELIPESSLPMGSGSADDTAFGYNVQSAHPASTTAQLAGHVPKEPRGVPEVVRESQQEAHAEPEASAVPEMVQEKKEVEQELLSKIPTADAAAESTRNETSGLSARSEGHAETGEQSSTPEASSSFGKLGGMIAAGATAAAATIADAAYAAKDKAVDTTSKATEAATETAYAAKDKVADTTSRATETATTSKPTSFLPVSIQKAIDQMNAGPGILGSSLASPLGGSTATPAAGVPEPVAESIQRAHESPEAAANPEAVREKGMMEEELMSKVHPADATKESVSRSAAPSSAEETSRAPHVPSVVADSIRQAHQSPEAAANPVAVRDKSELEQELLSKVPSTERVEKEIPVDSHVPAPVIKSIRKAHEDPEAAANPEAVMEKSEVEHELLSKVRSTGQSGLVSAAASSAQHDPSGAPVPKVVVDSIRRAREDPEAVANPEAVTEKSEVEHELLGKVRAPDSDSVGQSARGIAAVVPAGITPVTSHGSHVPEVVEESIRRAQVDPEAVTNPEAVVEKDAVEHELLKKVKPTNEMGEPAPTESEILSPVAPGDLRGDARSPTSALSATSLADREPLKSSTELAEPAYLNSQAPASMAAIRYPLAPSTHYPLASSAQYGQREAPVAASSTPQYAERMAEPAPKSTVPIVVPPSEEPSTMQQTLSTGLNAPAAAPAQSGATQIGQLAAQGETPVDSRDVSPMGRIVPGATSAPSQPTVTTGVASASTPSRSGTGAPAVPAAPATPQKPLAASTASTPASAAALTPQRDASQRHGGKSPAAESARTSDSAASADGKKKRRSFFGKLKDKFR